MSQSGNIAYPDYCAQGKWIAARWAWLSAVLRASVAGARVWAPGGAMEQEDNAKVVRDAYAAFARRDIATLLTFLDDAIVWNPVQGASAHVTVAGERRGKAAVADFFELLAREQ